MGTEVASKMMREHRVARDSNGKYYAYNFTWISEEEKRKDGIVTQIGPFETLQEMLKWLEQQCNSTDTNKLE